MKTSTTRKNAPTIHWNSQHIELAKVHATRSWRLWTLYSITLIMPVSLSLWALYSSFGYTPKNSDVGTNWVTKVVPGFFLLITIELIVDLFTKQKYYRLNDSVNSVFQGSFQQLFGLFIKAISLVPYMYINENYSVIKVDESSWIPWIVSFFAVDYAYYWFHRFAHEINILWASHIAHHSSEEYNLTTALRQGSYQPFFSWIFYIPFAFFFPVKIYYFHNHWNAIYQFWIHTRYVRKLPSWIEAIFNTPSHHRVHHGRNSQYIDKNYAGTLIIWDRIFGTFEPEQEEVVYGVTHHVGTWNPFYVQFYHIYETLKASSKTPGLFNKIRVFIDWGPGYNFEVLYPDEVKNPVKVTSKNQVKYDSGMPNIGMSVYAFAHSALSIVYTLVIGDNYNIVPLSTSIISCLIFVFGAFSISALFDQKQWARSIEYLRLIITLIYFTWLHVLPSNIDLESVTADMLLESRLFLVSLATVVLSVIVLTSLYKLSKQKVTKKTD